MSFYASFVYGLIYGSLAAVPYIFETFRGYHPVVASLPFLALLIGCLAGLVVNLGNTKFYVKAMKENDGKAVPEARLYPMMGGSFFLTAGIFILAWTGATTISWVVPCIGLLFIGFGFFPIFQGSLNYVSLTIRLSRSSADKVLQLIDSFLPVAASALATTIFMRCMLAAVFPLFMVRSPDLSLTWKILLTMSLDSDAASSGRWMGSLAARLCRSHDDTGSFFVLHFRPTAPCERKSYAHIEVIELHLQIDECVMLHFSHRNMHVRRETSY
jgi:hypothetical protein